MKRSMALTGGVTALILATPAHAGTVQMIQRTCTAVTFTNSISTTVSPAQCASPLTITADTGPGAIPQGRAGLATYTAPEGLSLQQVALLNPTAGSNVGAPGSAEWAAGISAGPSLTYLGGPTGALQTPGGLNVSAASVFLQCQSTSCADPASLSSQGVSITATETASPTLTPVLATNGSTDTNLLDVPAGQWIRATPSSHWNVSVLATDPTGICQLDLTQTPGPTLTAVNELPDQNAGWTQCDNPVRTSWPVDPTQLVPTTGHLMLTVDASDAADNPTEIATSNLKVDNVIPTLSFGAHRGSGTAVRVPVRAHTGSSGISRLTCSIDGHGAALSSARELSVPTGGTHKLACTVANYAVAPDGSHATATARHSLDLAGSVTLVAHGVSETWSYHHASARPTRISVPVGMAAQVTCAGRGCPHLNGTVSGTRNRTFAANDILTIKLSTGLSVKTKVRSNLRPLAVK